MKRIVLLLLLIAQPVWGAVSFDAVSTASGQSVASLSWNHTVTGANTVLYCGPAVSDSTPVTSVTYNAAAMTELANVSPAANYYIWAYRKIAPSTGLNAVEVTPGANADMAVGCISVAGAHQVSPEGTIDTDAHTTTPLEAVITVAAGGMGISFAFDKDTAACGAHTSTNTERYDLCDAGPNIGAFGSTTASTGSVTMGWTGLGGNYVGIIGIPVAQAAVVAATRRSVVIVE